MKTQRRRPNIVFFLLDDFGVKDLGCYGSTFHESPNVDRLAARGMRFTNAYASHPVCGPSRTAIMSGRYPGRLGVTNIDGKIEGAGVPWPQVLKDAGYATGFIGKWHMGDRESVIQSGFDSNVAGCEKGQPSDYYYPYKCKEHPGCDVPDMEDGKPGDYLTDKLTDKALNFIENNHEQPFLCYISYYQTHKPAIAPTQGKKEHVAHFKEKLSNMPEPEGPTTRVEVHGEAETVECLVQRNPEFAGQIKAVDDNVGRVLDRLEQLGIDDNTIVIFTSDQGSVCTSEEYMVSTQKPYRLGKAWMFDGGLRVPFLVRWPGEVTPGSVNNALTINTDIYPTILEVAGLPLKPEQHLDGVSIRDALTEDAKLPERPLIWVYDHDHNELGHKASVAIRKGNHKLIYWLANGHTELYDLEADVAEAHDLSQREPALVASLIEELKQVDFMQEYLQR
jgi:arylsulfatase A-like enzyme